ncbi:MAG: pilus assembly protein N-terminal domain-containing protein [Hyphomicrobiaceae bacterium]
MLKRVKNCITLMTTIATGIATALLVSIVSVQPALAEEANDFVIQYDQVRLLRLEDKAADVIVGNPSIADVAIQKGKLLAITGKTFGVTNLIVLDRAGRVMMNRRLIVSSDDQKIVNLMRGAKSQTYNCAPKCQPALKIGDDMEHYTALAKSSENKVKFSAGVSDGGSVGE